MKILAFALLTLYSAFGYAAAGSPCEKIEYARLKDSNKKELTGMYCRAVQRAKLNEDLYEIKNDLFRRLLAIGADANETQKEMSEIGSAQVSCVAVTEEVSAMLAKKYKVNKPNCS